MVRGGNRPASHRADSGQRQAQKSNSGAARRKTANRHRRLPDGNDAPLGTQMVDQCAAEAIVLLRDSSPQEVTAALHDAFAEFARSVRSDLKITVIVYAEDEESAS